MNISTLSQVRANFKQVLDDISTDHEPLVISRQNGEHVVMLSLADYNSMQETMYQLSSAENIASIERSLEQASADDSIGIDHAKRLLEEAKHRKLQSSGL